MMLGFQRTGNVKASLGLGEFEKRFRGIRERLDAILVGGEALWGVKNDVYNIDWAHRQDRGGGNCHCIGGLIDISEKHQDWTSIKDRIQMSDHYIKRVFRERDCKMISISYYHNRKLYKKYGFNPDIVGRFVLMEIKYSVKK